MSNPRIVIITGAAGGVGRAMLAEFAGRGDLVIGVDVAQSGVSEAVQALGDQHFGFECDLSDERNIMQLFEQIDGVVDHVDVLLNNAAVGPTMQPTLETDMAGFEKAISTNLYGPFVLAREAVKRMPETGGAIVNTASLAGVLGNPGRNAYAASKAALISMTKSLACEWAERNVRVTAIAPGYIRTPMVAALEKQGKADLSMVRQRVPVGRLGRSDEIASVAGFLASDAARYVTGSVVAVDGGWMSFNQPGTAHPPVDGAPQTELARPEADDAPRVVVVTGAGNGIGRAIAESFAANGDHVALIDKDAGAVRDAARALGDSHLAIEADISSEQSVAVAFAQIESRFGHVDVMVNNAGIADLFKPALEQDTGDLKRVMDVNLSGSFMCTKAALALMQGRAGFILNVGSINTFLPFAPRHAYGASKAAIDILTRCFAAELGQKGIRSATLAPGYIRTPGVAALEDSGKVDSVAIRKRIPLGDMGRPQDIADAALFLASPAASYINGGILYVDGGWTSFGGAGDASDGGQ
ncbi:SDR family oxidoreductase [Hoeflea sp. AS16]|uniref:SDR family oxidoreductase n=1 Tax=Hoeflea sp. AS16 TaxID=3135779 RepID=UPI003172D8D1